MSASLYESGMGPGGACAARGVMSASLCVSGVQPAGKRAARDVMSASLYVSGVKSAEVMRGCICVRSFWSCASSSGREDKRRWDRTERQKKIETDRRGVIVGKSEYGRDQTWYQ